MKTLATKLALIILTVLSSVAFAAPPMNYTVFRDIGAIDTYTNCGKGQSCNIIDAEKMAEKRKFMQNFNNQMFWLGRESERAAFNDDTEAVENVKKWFLDYESAPGLVYVFPNEGMDWKKYESLYQELHYVMFNISMSYYKTKQFFTPEEQKHVEAWLDKVIKINMYSDVSRFGYRTSGRNNHYFIIASSLAMTGVATGNKKYIEDAKNLIDESIDEMNWDGGWPLELKRSDKSGHYQMFMLNHMIVATMAIGIVDKKWSEKRLGKFKKAELFTAKLMSDDAFFVEQTGARPDHSFDHTPGKSCQGRVWSWMTLTKNKTEVEAILDSKYRVNYEGCTKDYLVGGDPSKLIGTIFK